jgi:hypothetical protein
MQSFIVFQPDLNTYRFDIATKDHVGTYEIMLMSTLGNNMTHYSKFTAQVASPCLNIPVTITPPPSVPVYDLSLWEPMYINLDWSVANTTESCGALYFNFKLVNATTLGTIEPNIFSIVNTTSGPDTGLQMLKIWTQAIPTAKLWTDLLVEARL